MLTATLSTQYAPQAHHILVPLSWICQYLSIFVYKGGKGISCDPLHTFNSCRNHQLGDTYTRVVEPFTRWGKSAPIGYSTIPTGCIDTVQLPFRTSFLAFLSTINVAKFYQKVKTYSLQTHNKQTDLVAHFKNKNGIHNE